MTTLDRKYPAIEGEDEYESEAEFEFEFEVEAEAEAEAELEDEFEAEAEEEAEGFANPIRRIYRDAELMAHLSSRAADAEAESEAEAFIGALVPLAARLIPRAAAVITRNAPALIQGANRISRQLRRDPRTRRLVRAMPVVLQRTAQVLADQDDGAYLPAADVVSTLGSVASAVLGPQRRSRALRAVGVFDDRYQRRARWQRRRRRAGYDRRRYARSASGYRARRHAPVRRSGRVRHR